MSRLILPGDRARAAGMPMILVPRGYEQQPPLMCRVPAHPSGEVCGARFWTEDQLARHARRCFEDHRDIVHELSPRTRMPIFDEANWDPEVAAHMREVGRRMLREGRLTVRKNERAGF